MECKLDKKTCIGLWMCRIPALAFAVLEARGCYLHFTTENWENHAQFHSLTGLSYYLGLTLFFLFITGKPFRNGEKWAWFSLVLMGVFVHGAHILIDSFTEGLRGGGTSQGAGMTFYYLTIAGFALYMIGAALAAPYFFKKKKTAQSEYKFSLQSS